MSTNRWALWETLRIGPPDDEYLVRLRVVSTPWLGVYLHRIIRPDAERHVHDHPWPFASLVLRGGYTEVIVRGTARTVAGVLGGGTIVQGTRRWRRGSFHRMPLDMAHRIVHVEPRTVTLVLVGRKVRDWGFWTDDGWVRWDEYLTDEYGTDRADRNIRYVCRGGDHEWDDPRRPCPTCYPDVPSDPNL